MLNCDATIAILLATYNGEEYLGRQINSLLHQTFQDFNIYIHDDGSKDNTAIIIDDYCKRYPTRIFTVAGGSTGGARNNFFYLMRNVNAKYYMFCDQDDFWKKDKVQRSFDTLKELEKGNEGLPLLAFTDLEVVDSELKTINVSMNKLQRLNPYNLTVNKIMCQNPITGCTMIMNKLLNEISLEYKNVNNIIMHDWWIALVAARYGKIAYCDEALIKYCQHGDNAVGAYNPNSPGYIKKKMFKISYLKNAIKNSRLQALELCDVFGENDNRLLFEFANLDKHSKIYRINFYIKNKVWKNGFVRNVGFLLLG